MSFLNMKLSKKWNLLILNVLVGAGSAQGEFCFHIPEIRSNSVELCVELSGGFTNRIEIYSCNSLSSNKWDVTSGVLSCNGSNFVFWSDPVLEEDSERFYCAGNVDLDSDSDSLPDAREHYVHGTATDLADSDGDGLPDGEEIRWSYTSPLVFNDILSDDDDDGLSLALEYAYGTNPGLDDTDQDGVSDGVEVAQGSDPSNSADFGAAPESNDFVVVNLSVSGVASTEYVTLRLGDLRVLSGVVDSHEFRIFKGGSLDATVEFVGSDLPTPVYAYKATVSEVGSTNAVFIDDQNQVLGSHSGTGGFSAEGKSALVIIPKFELTIFVDQPVAGDRDTKYRLIGGRVFTGHSWWEMSVEPVSFIENFVQDVDRARFLNMPTGFYPENYPDHDLGKFKHSVPADLRYPDPDNRFSPDVIKSFSAEWATVQMALDRVAELDADHGTFDINDHNCCDVSLEIAALCGHILPDTYGSWAPYGGGTNPADLGEDLWVLTD